MKKILLFVLILENVVLLAPPKKGWKPETVAKTINSNNPINLATTALVTTTTSLISTQVGSLPNTSENSSNFLRDEEKNNKTRIDNDDSNTPTPEKTVYNSPATMPIDNSESKNQNDDSLEICDDQDDFDTFEENEHETVVTDNSHKKNQNLDTVKEHVGNGKVKTLKETLHRLKNLWKQTQEELNKTIQKTFNLTSAYDILHTLAINDELENHLRVLNQQKLGEGNRFIDTAITTAIQDQNEIMLKNILLDVEKVSTSNLSDNTKAYIANFLIDCSQARQRKIIDLVASYIQECDENASFVRKFTNSTSTEEKRYNLSEIIKDTQKTIETLTKHFSGETLFRNAK